MIGAPASIAGATFTISWASGRLYGVIARTRRYGCGVVTASRSPPGPDSRVEVPSRWCTASAASWSQRTERSTSFSASVTGMPISAEMDAAISALRASNPSAQSRSTRARSAAASARTGPRPRGTSRAEAWLTVATSRPS